MFANASWLQAMFADPHTHTSLAGATLNAAIVAEALRAVPGNPLGAHLRPAAP